MHKTLLILSSLVIALVAVGFMHPHIVRIAKLKQIVDKPNARKLQKEPVAILGGVLVFFGIILSTAILDMVGDCSSLFVVIAAMMIMLYTGTMDDILNLRPSTRFVSQIFAVCLLIFAATTVWTTSTVCGACGACPARSRCRSRSSHAWESSMP